MKNGILFFIKNPVPGKVKTRLAQSIGDTHAYELYKRFVLDLMDLLKQSTIPILIFYDPFESEREIRNWLQPEETIYPQTGLDLGEKMKNAFQKGFEMGYEKLFIIGSDCLDFQRGFFHYCFHQLQHYPTIIGPSYDGGYYLLGFQKESFLPSVFDGIQWSTHFVFSHTLSFLKQNNTSVFILDQKRDIDQWEDLKFYYSNHQNNHSLTIDYIKSHQKDLLQ